MVFLTSIIGRAEKSKDRIRGLNKHRRDAK
jgi:hypothetical protein